MLVSKTEVDAACTLSIDDVCAAMSRSGYTIGRGEITGVDFRGMTCQGVFVYSIAGPNPDGPEFDDCTLGNVYLSFKRKVMSTEIELRGEY